MWPSCNCRVCILTIIWRWSSWCRWWTMRWSRCIAAHWFAHCKTYNILYYREFTDVTSFDNWHLTYFWRGKHYVSAGYRVRIFWSVITKTTLYTNRRPSQKHHLSEYFSQEGKICEEYKYSNNVLPFTAFKHIYSITKYQQRDII